MTEEELRRMIGDKLPKHPSIWLTMSGGGFRAALFHYGCLKRLNELGLLGHVLGISATSGGAMVASLLNRAQTDIKVTEDNHVLYRYDWDKFERAVLNLTMRGVLFPTTMLVITYGFYLAALGLGFLGSSGYAVFAGIGLLIHFALIFYLIRNKYHKRYTDKRPQVYDAGPSYPGTTASSRLSRFVRLCTVPSYLRWQTIDQVAFDEEALWSMSDFPYTYLTAVDLNEGAERVFTKGLIAGLDRTSVLELWKNYGRERNAESVPIALVVAANTAFVPFFRPVRIRFGGSSEAVFVDGGLLDNLAINLPKAFSAYTRGSAGSFDELVKHILILDGSAVVKKEEIHRWLRIRSLLRLASILQNSQVEDFELSGENFKSSSKIPTEGLGLRYTFAENSELFDLTEHIARIRTNLDTFSASECALLAYSGYYSVDQVLKKWKSLGTLPGVVNKSARKLPDILPDYCGPWYKSVGDLKQHVKYSNRKFSVFRFIGRRFRL